VLLVDPEREQISRVAFPLPVLPVLPTAPTAPTLTAPRPGAEEPAVAQTASAWPLLVCIAFCMLSAYLWMR
jgi:hypothetical protein